MKSKLMLTCAVSALSLYFCSEMQAQSFSKLEVAAGDVFYVEAGNQLTVDTLVLHDNATVQFASTSLGKLHAKVAYVGNACVITAKGQDGKNGRNGESGGVYGESGQSGERGRDGGNLELKFNFVSLGNLTIDTRGGDGGNGGNGGHGARGTRDKTETRTSTDGKGNSHSFTLNIPGRPGGQGGDGGTSGVGGNGGDITLIYSTSDFIPVFNHGAKKNGIDIALQAGKNGFNGKPGRGGINAADGKQLYNGESSAVDGSIKLINAKPQQ